MPWPICGMLLDKRLNGQADLQFRVRKPVLADAEPAGITARDGFRIVSGSDSIKEYESSPGKKRCFCATCGSHVYAYLDDKPNFVILRLGTLDGDPGIRATHHIWMSQKASWYEVLVDLPKHEKM